MNNFISTAPLYGDYLAHHGIKGMKWGIRRFQNEDGTLTEAGKKRYNREELKEIRSERKKLSKKYTTESKDYKKAEQLAKQAYDLYDKYDFDADDGGGGRTKADQRAGEKYMQLWSDHEVLMDRAEKEGFQKATDAIVDKYGEIAVKQISAQNDRRAMLGAALAVGLTVGPLIGFGIAAGK